MREAERSPEALSPEVVNLRLRLAGAALLWERAWPAAWPVLGVIGVFLVLALFDLPARLPAWLHGTLLILMAGALALGLIALVSRLRWPDRGAARRRIETASGLAHRPLTALADRLSGGGDPGTAALWQMHRARMAAQAKQLRVGLPAAGLLRRDPFALRGLLLLMLVIAAIDAGGDWSDRLLRSLMPSLAAAGPAASVSLDIWMTPPDYTGLPPQLLPAATPDKPIAVPTGSAILAQVHGGRGVPALLIDGKPAAFARIDEHNFKGGATLTAGQKLAIEQDGRVLGAWPITVIPDLPPKIAFAAPPQRTQHEALRLEYQASDDYGVEGVKALIRRKGDASGETLTLDLPLPSPHLREARNASFHDLTAHPWAGLPVEIRLQAADALGQTAESDVVEMPLPERVFHHPVARALIDQRKQLTLAPQDRDVVAETLSDLSLRPRLFGDDNVVFLALRTAQARLQLDHGEEAIPAVQQLLWETALRIEDGNSSVAQRDLRNAMQALQEALARNAPDAEIERLMQELQQAIDRYLQALAENLQRQGDQQSQEALDPSTMLNRQDLQKMLDRARELARTGSRNAARDMLSQLQEMLENLRAARPGEMQSGQGQAMREMQEMMQRQQQLLDRSFRMSRQGQRGQRGRNSQGGQPQTGEGQAGQQGQGEEQAGDGATAGDQEALRRRLGDMMRQLGESGGDIPQSLGRAERAMRGAAEALNHGQPGNAIAPQSEALDQLQQAARNMAEQAMGQSNGAQNGGRDGARPTERDPFGRLTNQDRANGGMDDGGRMRMGEGPNLDFGVEKAKGILEELRRRAGERSRPEIERDYIDRLLKQF